MENGIAGILNSVRINFVWQNAGIFGSVYRNDSAIFLINFAFAGGVNLKSLPTIPDGSYIIGKLENSNPFNRIANTTVDFGRTLVGGSSNTKPDGFAATVRMYLYYDGINTYIITDQTAPLFGEYGTYYMPPITLPFNSRSK